MTTTKTEHLSLFDSHPSLSATSLEDFEARDSPTFRIPSQHSGFRSESSEMGDAESDLDRPWSPKPWRRPEAAGSGWYRHQPYRNETRSRSPTKSRSRDGSVPFESALENDNDDDNDVTLAANIPLPRGSLSPVKERTRTPSPSPSQKGAVIPEEEEEEEEAEQETSSEKGEPDNCAYQNTSNPRSPPIPFPPPPKPPSPPLAAASLDKPSCPGSEHQHPSPSR